MRKVTTLLLLLGLSSPALADSYQTTYSWTAPTWQSYDTPTYGARYRLDGGTPVVLTDTAIPSGGFTYTAAPGTVLEVCPQNKNGTLITPDCSQAGHWVTVGASPYPPTVPPMPAGFSAIIIRTGN